MSIALSASQRKPLLRWMALTGWVFVVLAQLLLFIVDLSSDYAQMLLPCTDALGYGGACNFLAISAAEVAVLSSWGLSLRFYATVMIIAPVILLLVYWALAAVILWRQRASWLGLAVSLALIVLPMSTVSGDNDWSALDPGLFFLAVAVAILGTGIQVTFLYLIPNGRFSPRWAFIPLLGTIFLVGVLTLQINGILALSTATQSLLQSATVFLVLLAGILQIYRYLRDANPSERQQTKWILFGVVSYVLSVMVWILIFGGVLALPAGSLRLLAYLGGWFFIDSFLLLILPATITIAILRYRLWDIDLIIRKTLAYALLSALLTFVYFGLVISLQSVFDSVVGQESPLIIVVSTLAIAALFVPLRRWVQTFIDRRFFRQKYDAQQVLARFAHAAHHEVSLEALAAELSRAVQDTMQPQEITIWLKEQTKSKRQRPSPN